MRQTFFLIVFSLIFLNSNSQVQVKELSNYVFPEFTKGIVLMKSGQKIQKILNYNTITEEMVFIERDKKMAITNGEMERIDTVFISNRKFFVLNGKFVEFICHSGFDLYCENRCQKKDPGKPAGYGGTSQTASSTSYSSLESNGNIYEMKLVEYETIPYTVYWLKKDGKLNKFLNMKQLMKLYKDRKDMFKTYVKGHNVKYEDRESMVQLIKYLETE